MDWTKGDGNDGGESLPDESKEETIVGVVV